MNTPPNHSLRSRFAGTPMSGFARHRRSGLIIANFTGFEADLLRVPGLPAGRAAAQRGGRARATAATRSRR